MEEFNPHKGIYEKLAKSPTPMIIEASHEIIRNCMAQGTHIICHPRHRPHFTARMGDYGRLVPCMKSGEPDRFAGMEIIWSTQHGLEVLSDGVAR